jgi:uncharacterized membrane protein
MKRSHMWICGTFAALTVVFAVAGAEAWAFIPAAGCAVMCATMVWTMVRSAKHSKHA